jgi:hypothetical protein
VIVPHVKLSCYHSQSSTIVRMDIGLVYGREGIKVIRNIFGLNSRIGRVFPGLGCPYDNFSLGVKFYLGGD